MKTTHGSKSSPKLVSIRMIKLALTNPVKLSPAIEPCSKSSPLMVSTPSSSIASNSESSPLKKSRKLRRSSKVLLSCPTLSKLSAKS